MDSIFGLAAILVGLFVFLHVYALVLTTARLIKLQFRALSFTTIERGGAGAELPALDAGMALLQQHGFAYVGTRRVRSIVASASMLPAHVDLYYHAGHDVRAEVCTASMPTPQWPCDIHLLNTFTDGTALLTVNRLAHQLLTYPGRVTIADAYAPSFALQLAHHLKLREDIYKERTAPADADAIDTEMARSMLPDLAEEGKAYRRGDLEGEAVFSLRLGAALRAASRLRAGLKRVRQADALQEREVMPPAASAAAMHAAERVAFERNLSILHAMRAPRWFRWSAFVVSALAFVALGIWWWDVSFALVVGAVVALHEGGHWLVMRVARFRDVQVFFLPGFGAATSGEKHDASPLTHLAVYLAGPVPGMLLAIGGIGWLLYGQPDASAWWYQPMLLAIIIGFAINVTNLAPVMPFDGGRVVDMFIMGRLPWFRFAFSLASGAFLVWLGFRMDAKIISGLGLLSLLGLSHQYRIAMASRDLLRETGGAPLASDSFAAATGRLYDFLAQPQYRHWSFDSKMSIGQSILPRFLGRLPTMAETVLGLVIYLACIVAPVAAVAVIALERPAQFNALSPFKIGAATQATRV